MSREPQYGIEP